MNTFRGKVPDFRRKFFPAERIRKFRQTEKVNNLWLKEVENDVFHLIECAVVTLGAKKPGRPEFTLQEQEVQKIEALVEAWLKLRGRELFLPNSNEPSAERARRNGIESLTKAVIDEEPLILLTPLCPNHQFDETGGILIDNKVHPKAEKASGEFKELREIFREGGVKNIKHVILLGNVDLSQALIERFSKEELEKQLEGNFQVWRGLFSDDGVEIRRMTELFSEEKWLEKQKELLDKIQNGFLSSEINHVAMGRREPMEKRSGRPVTEEEVLQRTQDSIAAHLATNSFLKELLPEAILLDASNGIDLLWTMNAEPGPKILCLSVVHNHQPWRD